MSEFRFKQFSVIQRVNTMKITTDSVILGAWASSENPQKILDIGTGTGVLALMMAQRFHAAEITAVEIVKEAANEAAENFKNSPWANRLKIVVADFKDFANLSAEKFDLIISNPPFFENQLRSPDKQKTLVRHTDKLSYQDLFAFAKKIITSSGKFCLVMPANIFDKISKIAEKNNFFLTKIVKIYPKPSKNYNRLLLEFSPKQTDLQEHTLTIRNEDNSYTAEYLRLTKEFYLFA